MSEKCTAIVLAAGKGKRMHSKITEISFWKYRDTGAILFPALFSGKQYDSGYYSGNK